MSRNYHSIAFTGPVLESQARYGSRASLERVEHHLRGSGPPTGSQAPQAPGASSLQVPKHDTDGSTGDPLGEDEREFIAEQDGFYMATVSESGWPYVQFRGGPPGFVKSPDAHTLAWADFRGNRQYISTGNLDHDPRVALIFMDYAYQRRLKIYGIARVKDVHADRQGSSPLSIPWYRAKVEREVRIEVSAFDWNCPQHITPRYTAAELGPAIDPLRRRIAELETENADLRMRQGSTDQVPDAMVSDARTHSPKAAPRKDDGQ